MSEISNLAQNFKKKSNEKTQAIEKEVERATTQLNSFMTAKLKESETIIRQGMDNLDESNEDLITQLSTQKTDIDTALKTYLEQIQAPLTQDLNELVEQTQNMIDEYTEYTRILIINRQQKLIKTIRTDLKKWMVIVSFIAILLLITGAGLGAFIVQRFSKPVQIIYQPQTQQPIDYGRR